MYAKVDRAMISKAREAVRNFAYGDHVSDFAGWNRPMLRREMDETGRPIGRCAHVYAYGKAFYAMQDGTICSVSERTGWADRWMVDWRTW